MDGDGTFNRLVAELSQGERHALLGKLESQSVISPAPLFKPGEISEAIELERRFNESAWYVKICYRLLGMIQSKKPIDLFEDSLISKLGVSIEQRFPDIYNHRRGLLLSGFRNELSSLKESARFFYDALDGSVVRDKAAFFAFLGSLEMDEIHQRLCLEADPAAYASTNSLATEQEIRQATTRSLENILAEIDDEQRKTMYRDVRALLCLKELAAFLFDRSLGSFSQITAKEAASCPAYLIQDQLISLNDILFSLEFPPSLALLESLFIFDLQEKLGSKGFNVEIEIHALVLKAEAALAVIRQFNQKVPLTALLRCFSRDLSYAPRLVPGGEDWFVVYRDFWRKTLDDQYGAFVRERRRGQLLESIVAFLRGRSPSLLANVCCPENPEGLPVRLGFALAFLRGFHSSIFMEEIHRVLKPILVDGEFYKRENRVEFTDAYNTLLKLGDAITAFDRKLGPEGEMGTRWDLARKDTSALPVKRRKIAALNQEVEAEALALVGTASRSLSSLSGCLNGIISTHSGGRYDTLSNLPVFSGKGVNFPAFIRLALQNVDKAVQLLGEIEALESGR